MTDADYMQLALVEAKKAEANGDVPVGAVIVKAGEVIAKAHNMREECCDSTAHAEVIAIRKACEHLHSWRLINCTMYVTLEPCPMCAGALVLSRMARLVYGAADIKMGACESLFNIVSNKNLNHSIDVTAGVCEQQCKEMLQEFFKSKR